MARFGLLSWLSIAIGIASGVISVFGAPDELGQKLVRNCHRPAFREAKGITFATWFPPADWTWCVLTTFVKGFAETKLGVGLFALVISLLIPAWAYFATVMMIHEPVAKMQPFAIALLLVVSQLIGFQGILTLYWIPLVLATSGWSLRRCAFNKGAGDVVFWTAMLQLLLGSIVLVVNVNSEWYQASQMFFQFYPLATPVVWSMCGIPQQDKSGSAHAMIARAYTWLSVLSALLWWAGLAFVFFQPAGHTGAKGLLKTPAVNPALAEMIQTFPDWQFVLPWSDGEILSSGQLFSGFDILLISLSLFVLLYLEVRRTPQSKDGKVSLLLTLVSTILAGPGYAAAVNLAALFRYQSGDERSKQSLKKKA